MNKPASHSGEDGARNEAALHPAPLRLRFAAMFYDALLVTALLFLVTALSLGLITARHDAAQTEDASASVSSSAAAPVAEAVAPPPAAAPAASAEGTKNASPASASGPLRTPGFPRILFQLALLATVLLYFSGFWRLSGQTPGMRAWGVRLQTLEGGRPGMSCGLLRCISASVSLACLGLGYWVAWTNAERLCWHDRWSRTRMVRLPSRRLQTARNIHSAQSSSRPGGRNADQNGDRE